MRKLMSFLISRQLYHLLIDVFVIGVMFLWSVWNQFVIGEAETCKIARLHKGPK